MIPKRHLKAFLRQNKRLIGDYFRDFIGFILSIILAIIIGLILCWIFAV